MDLNDLSKLPHNMAAKVEPVPPSTCWVWMGAINSAGYGTVQVRGKSHLVHRLAYQILVGPIPKGLTIDHLCRVPLCVNPTHMDVVTQRENTLRGNSISARWARRTHCEKCGRELGFVNKYRPRGCKPCWAAYMKDFCRKDYQKNRALRLAQAKEYNRTHREHINEMRRLSRRRNREKALAAKSAEKAGSNG